ncbi:MAG: 7-cyano-7-deazaguanine synthase QueC [Chloroherpetonaceae bacterium]|nr:7-cyano-7-deazaguanine synthase QueC [Chthonomonadaceae bacterium]MDW8206868.1 7-cyano-7-deazaguanine synthase QueC [Chloroherpetonaceae bacterium]
MKAVVLVSGGMDSCVTLGIAHARGEELYLLHVNYGQRTERRELQAFHELAAHYDVPSERRLVCSIQHLAAIGGSSLTDTRIPVSEADLDNPEIPTSYVPFRNAHLLSIAVSWAEVVQARHIYIGAVAEDSSGYPDCRPEYYETFNALIRVGTARGDMRIETPIIHCSKEEIVRKGIGVNAPFHLTWSCYRNEDVACGTCDSCALRLRGFQRAGVEDPIPYALRPRYDG